MAAALAVGLIAGAAAWPTRGAAEGALAVGLPDDVAKDGFAFGFALDKASDEEARAAALADCRAESPGVDKRAQALCAPAAAFAINALRSPWTPRTPHPASAGRSRRTSRRRAARRSPNAWRPRERTGATPAR